MLQDLRTLAEKTKRDLSRAESKKLIVRSTGVAANFTVTRKQFEEMTADLLDETIRITKRTLDEAEQRYPGIREQISELLLVGGSSRMPAVAEALKREFSWEPKLTDPDLAVAKGAALYAGGPDRALRGVGRQTATARRRRVRTAPAAPPRSRRPARQRRGHPGGRGAVRPQRRAGPGLAQRTVVNVLPKSIGIKLVDTTKPDWEDDPRRPPTSSTWSPPRPSCRSRPSRSWPAP